MGGRKRRTPVWLQLTDKGRTSQTGRQQISTGLDRATCVAADGRTTAVTGGLTALVLALGGAAGAVLVALLALGQRR